MKDFVHKVNGRIISGAKDCREGNRDKGMDTGVMKKLDDAGVFDSLEDDV